LRPGQTSNGRLFSRVPLTAGTTSFTGIQVSADGTAPVGDDMFIDQFGKLTPRSCPGAVASGGRT